METCEYSFSSASHNPDKQHDSFYLENSSKAALCASDVICWPGWQWWGQCWAWAVVTRQHKPWHGSLCLTVLGSAHLHIILDYNTHTGAANFEFFFVIKFLSCDVPCCSTNILWQKKNVVADHRWQNLETQWAIISWRKTVSHWRKVLLIRGFFTLLCHPYGSGTMPPLQTHRMLDVHV